MKRLLIALFLFSEITAFAQKEEDIEYYTDSDVHRSIVSLQLGYMPYMSNRRLLANTVNPQADYFFLNTATTSKFGQGFGGDLLFKLNTNFEVGIGYYFTQAHYQWDFVKIIDNIQGGNSDTLDVTSWDIYANHHTVPIQFGFVTQVSDQWWLQVYPALELNFLEKLEYDYQVVDEPQPRIENVTDSLGNSFNMAINFGLGAEYRIVPKFGVFARLQFRYYFFPLSEETIVREILYTVGGHAGIRYYF